MANNSTYQYEPLPIPSHWSREERQFAQRLTDVLDDIYLKWGRISEKELSSALRQTIRGKADASALENFSTIEQTAELVKTEVGAIAIGGRNLLLGTDKPIEAEQDGQIGSYERANLETLAGQITQLHFDLEATPGAIISISAGLEHIATHTVGSGSEQVRIAHTFSSDAWTQIDFSVSGSSGSTKISRVQLERGDVATDWGQADGELIAGSDVEITKDHVIIQTPVFSVGHGGNEFLALDANGGYMPKLSSPQVFARYDGPSEIAVSSGEVDGVSVFASLADAFETLSDHQIDTDITINVSSHLEYEPITLRGVYGSGKVTINGGNATIHNAFFVKDCGAAIEIYSIKARHSGSPVEVSNCAYVVIDGSTLECTGESAVVNVTGGSTVRITNTTMAAGNFSVRAWYGSRVTVYNCKGTQNLCSQAAFVIGAGTLPSASSSAVTTTAYQNGYINATGTVSRGSGSGTIPTPGDAPSSTDAVFARETGYHQTVWNNGGGYFYQGIVGSYGNITGCMWFDVSGHSGKAVSGAKLRLTRVAGYGTSEAVPVRLMGLSASCTGIGTTLSRTKDYGQIGTIAAGKTKYFTIPAAAAQDMIDGTIGGLCLYSADTTIQSGLGYSASYARFVGTAGDDNTKPRLSIAT